MYHKKTIFLYFWYISLWFYSNFDWERSLDVELNSTSNEYPLGILLTDPITPKKRNTWKNKMMMSSFPFFQVFLLFGVAVSIKSMMCGYSLVIITIVQVFVIFQVAGSIKSMHYGYSLDAETNSASNDLSQSKFE